MVLNGSPIVSIYFFIKFTRHAQTCLSHLSGDRLSAQWNSLPLMPTTYSTKVGIISDQTGAPCSVPSALHTVLVASLPCRLITCSSQRAASSPETLPQSILHSHVIQTPAWLPWLPHDVVKWGQSGPPKLPPCCRCTRPSSEEMGLLAVILHLCQEISSPREYVNHHIGELLYAWVHFLLLGKIAYNQKTVLVTQSCSTLLWPHRL